MVRHSAGVCIVLLSACSPPQADPATPRQCSSTVVIETQSDLDAFGDTTCVLGDLIIGRTVENFCSNLTPPFRAFDLSKAFRSLESVSGEIRFTDVAIGPKVSFPALKSTSKVEICHDEGETEFDFPLLERGSVIAPKPASLNLPSLVQSDEIRINIVGSEFKLPRLATARRLHVGQFSKLVMPKLNEVSESLNLGMSYNRQKSASVVLAPVLETVKMLTVFSAFGEGCSGQKTLFPKLKNVVGNATFGIRNTEGCKLELRELETIGGRLGFDPKDGALDVSLPKLLEADEIQFGKFTKGFDAPVLEKLKTLRVFTGNQLERLSLPNVKNVTFLSIQSNANLKIVELNALESVPFRFEWRGETHPEIRASIPLTNAGELILQGTSLRDWPFPFLQSANSLVVKQNPNLEHATSKELNKFSNSVVACANGGSRPCSFKAPRAEEMKYRKSSYREGSKAYGFYGIRDFMALSMGKGVSEEELKRSAERALRRFKKKYRIELKSGDLFTAFSGGIPASSSKFVSVNPSIVAYLFDKRRPRELRRIVLYRWNSDATQLKVVGEMKLPRPKPGQPQAKVYMGRYSLVVVQSEDKPGQFGPVLTVRAFVNGRAKKLPSINLGRQGKDRFAVDSPVQHIKVADEGGTLRISVAGQQHDPSRAPMVFRLIDGKWVGEAALQNVYPPGESFSPKGEERAALKFHRSQMKSKMKYPRDAKGRIKVGGCTFNVAPPKCARGTTEGRGSKGESLCLDSNGKIHGKVVRWYDASGCLQNVSGRGNRSGNVSARLVSRYVHGIETGPRIEYDSNGKPMRVTRFDRKGVLHGRMLSRVTSDKSGVYYKGRKVGLWSSQFGSIVDAEYYPFDPNESVVRGIRLYLDD